MDHMDRFAHLPEIIFVAKAQNAFARRANLFPKALGIFVSRDLRRLRTTNHIRADQLETLTSKSQANLNCVFLEIIAKRKIAEHLEERVMPRRLSYFVEIVVLAAGANALLRRSARTYSRFSAPRKTSLN